MFETCGKIKKKTNKKGFNMLNNKQKPTFTFNNINFYHNTDSKTFVSEDGKTYFEEDAMGFPNFSKGLQQDDKFIAEGI